KVFVLAGGPFPSHHAQNSFFEGSAVKMAHCFALLSCKPDGLLRQNRFTLYHFSSRPPSVPNGRQALNMPLSFR
ncbi:MAG: hypothetical protein ACKVON_05105, partial [Beijerinckiaceae bacterium]